MSGGLRARLIGDSFVEMITAALEELGWLDATIHDDPPGTRRHKPVRILGKAVKWNEPIEPNLLAVSTQDSENFEAELGSDLLRVEVPYIVDIYAESESLGNHISGDVFDILRGRYPLVDRTRPTFPVFDYRAATPIQIATCEIENVQRSRTPMRVERPWLQNWFVVSANVIDHRSGADALAD